MFLLRFHNEACTCHITRSLPGYNSLCKYSTLSWVSIGSPNKRPKVDITPAIQIDERFLNDFLKLSSCQAHSIWKHIERCCSRLHLTCCSKFVIRIHTFTVGRRLYYTTTSYGWHTKHSPKRELHLLHVIFCVHIQTFLTNTKTSYLFHAYHPSLIHSSRYTRSMSLQSTLECKLKSIQK